MGCGDETHMCGQASVKWIREGEMSGVDQATKFVQLLPQPPSLQKFQCEFILILLQGNFATAIVLSNSIRQPWLTECSAATKHSAQYSEGLLCSSFLHSSTVQPISPVFTQDLADTMSFQTEAGTTVRLILYQHPDTVIGYSINMEKRLCSWVSDWMLSHQACPWGTAPTLLVKPSEVSQFSRFIAPQMLFAIGIKIKKMPNFWARWQCKATFKYGSVCVDFWQSLCPKN